jgi:hypothetical protein
MILKTRPTEKIKAMIAELKGDPKSVPLKDPSGPTG